MKKIMISMVGVLLATGVSQAASILWKTPVSVSGDGVSDISQSGELLYGVSFFTPRGNKPDIGYVDGSATLVNGVLFDLPSVNNNVSVSFRSQTMDNRIRQPIPVAVAKDTDYGKLFLSNVWEAIGENGTVTLNNLVIGKEYEIQVFVGDARYTSETTSVDGIELNVAAGQYLVGTFRADANTQEITLDGSGVFTALQVRHLSKPRPLGLIFACVDDTNRSDRWFKL